MRSQALQNFPPDYSQSMNTVLTQELHRFNVLADTIKGNLRDILDAIQGKITMSNTIELIDFVRYLMEKCRNAGWINRILVSKPWLGIYQT